MRKVNLIPMAGAGSRFVKAGYTFPKPLINVKGTYFPQQLLLKLMLLILLIPRD